MLTNLHVEKGDNISPDTITYITMLVAFQIVLNCQLELKDTIYDQGQARVKVREAVNVLNLKNNKNVQKIWGTDPVLVADFSKGMEEICKQIAKCDGEILKQIADLTRQGIDLSKYKLVEIDVEDTQE